RVSRKPLGVPFYQPRRCGLMKATSEVDHVNPEEGVGWSQRKGTPASAEYTPEAQPEVEPRRCFRAGDRSRCDPLPEGKWTRPRWLRGSEDVSRAGGTPQSPATTEPVQVRRRAGNAG